MKAGKADSRAGRLFARQNTGGKGLALCGIPLELMGDAVQYVVRPHCRRFVRAGAAPFVPDANRDARCQVMVISRAPFHPTPGTVSFLWRDAGPACSLPAA